MISLNGKERSTLISQLGRDSDFLRRNGIMDYSLLLAIEKSEESEAREYCGFNELLLVDSKRSLINLSRPSNDSHYDNLGSF
jgi:hypothetical protein